MSERQEFLERLEDPVYLDEAGRILATTKRNFLAYLAQLDAPAALALMDRTEPKHHSTRCLVAATVPLSRELVSRHAQGGLYAFAHNPYMSEPLAAIATDVWWRELRSTEGHAYVRGAALDGLTILQDRGLLDQPAGFVEHLVEIATARDPRSSVGLLKSAVEDLLLKLSNLPASALLSIAAATRYWPKGQAIAAHPNASPAVWIQLLESEMAHLVDDTVAGQEAALRSPGVRRLLARSARPSVLDRVLDYASPGEAGPIFQTLARNFPQVALARLRKRHPTAIEPADMKPLLESSDANIRLAAIEAVQGVPDRRRAHTP